MRSKLVWALLRQPPPGPERDENNYVGLATITIAVAMSL